MNKRTISEPPRAFVDTDVLNDWEFAASHPQLLEIVRLAKLGLWAETHSSAIEDAITGTIARMPVSHISRYEKALDSKPKREA